MALAHIRVSLWQQIVACIRILWEIIYQRRVIKRRGIAEWACDPSIRGKTVIVTGPTSGIGLEIAKRLALAGAHVVLACRRPDAAKRLIAEWQGEAGSASDVSCEVRQVDLESLASVRAFAHAWEAERRPLHVLVNNAGIFSMGAPQRLTGEGLEEHIAVNCVCPLLLSLLLLPSLRRAHGARIVNVSSTMHAWGDLDVGDLSFKGRRRRFNATAAYNQSKLAQLMLTNLLQRRLPASARIDVIAVHPGEVLTNVARTLPKAIQRLQSAVMHAVLLEPWQGALAPLYCATHPAVGEHAREVRERGLSSGPYFDFDGSRGEVAPHGCNKRVAEELWRVVLDTVGLDAVDVAAMISALGE
ncbi:hypothetical protein CLOM_g16705 [Closterium sp. NIES-68]|nr:hypothetical protein CLOM_g16705 [Closterium sp. NIES-68]GJP82828.1 hypothetical protein CLOP_g13055 [Closterium sp. NIES-67]